MRRAARACGDDLADGGAEECVTGAGGGSGTLSGAPSDQGPQPGEREEVPVADEDVSGGGLGRRLYDDREVVKTGRRGPQTVLPDVRVKGKDGCRCTPCPPCKTCPEFLDQRGGRLLNSRSMNPRVDLTRRRHIDLAHVSSAFCCR